MPENSSIIHRLLELKFPLRTLFSLSFLSLWFTISLNFPFFLLSFQKEITSAEFMIILRARSFRCCSISHINATDCCFCVCSARRSSLARLGWKEKCFKQINMQILMRFARWRGSLEMHKQWHFNWRRSEEERKKEWEKEKRRSDEFNCDVKFVRFQWKNYS